MKSTFKWKNGSPGVNAEIAGVELERIRESNEGVLRPRDVVEESRPEAAPLHPAFEWNDERAAELYREDQARRVIRSLVVVTVDPKTEQTQSQPVYLHVAPAEDRQQQQYLRADEIMQSQSLKSQVLADAIRQLAAWRKRYEHLSELAGVIASVDQAVAAVRDGMTANEAELTAN